jgi:hypothetical protein
VRRFLRRLCVWRGRRIGGGSSGGTERRRRLKGLRRGKLERNELRPYKGRQDGHERQAGHVMPCPYDHREMHREKKRGKVRCADADKELDGQRIRRWRLKDKVKEPVQPKIVSVSPSRLRGKIEAIVIGVLPGRSARAFARLEDAGRETRCDHAHH